MEITGKIKFIDETKSYGDNGFRKREVVVTTEGDYPQHILLEFIKDKCDILSNYKINDSVKVGINLKGREWVSPQKETKYFNSIEAWKIEKSDGQQNESTPQIKSAEAQAVAGDGLPF